MGLRRASIARGVQPPYARGGRRWSNSGEAGNRNARSSQRPAKEAGEGRPHICGNTADDPAVVDIVLDEDPELVGKAPPERSSR